MAVVATLGSAGVVILINSPLAAATSNTINFQARLESSAGAIAADGNYNVEFKLHTTSASAGGGNGACTGDCVWMEDWTYNSGAGSTDVRLHVANGYLTVNLGANTAFPTTINWDQQLWLTMNIGGTSGTSVTWDGEMNPRLQLTATPYAFAAGQLRVYNTSTSFYSQLVLTSPATANETITVPDAGGNATVCLVGASSCSAAGSGFVQFAPTTAQTNGGTNSSIFINNTSSGNLLQLQGSSSNKLLVDSSGNITSAAGTISLTAAATLQEASAATGTTLTVKGGNATSGTNAGGTLLLQGGAGSTTGASGSVIVKSNVNNSATAFQVQDASSNAILSVASTGSGVVSVGYSGGAAIPLQVTGAILQSGMPTPSTGASNNNYYTELGSCTITYQYSGCYTVVNIVGGNNGTTTDNSQAVVSFDVYQQNAMGSAPYVLVTVGSNAEQITAANLVAVTTTNTGANTTVQLWAKIVNQYEQWRYTPVLVGGIATTTWTPNTALQVSLPAGTQTTGSYSDVNASTITLQNTSPTAVQIQNTSGYNVFSVDTSANLVKIGSANLTGSASFYTSGSSGSIALTSANPGSTSYTVTLPAATGTVCLQSSAACGFATGSGTAFLQGGNTGLSSPASLGTNDSNVLDFRTNNANVVQLDTSGNLTFLQASILNVADAATGTTLTVKGGNATSGTNSGGTLLLQGGAGSTTGASGSVIVKSNVNNSATAFQVQRASAADVLTVDTVNSQLLLRNLNDLAVPGGETFLASNSQTLLHTATAWTVTDNTFGQTVTAAHATTSAVAVTANPAMTPTVGTTYQVSFSVSSMTAGSVTASYGGVSDPTAVTSNMTETALITATTSGNLTFTPTTTFDGTIGNISVIAVTPQTAVVATKDSTGPNALELRVTTASTGSLGFGLGSLAYNSANNNTAFGTYALRNVTTANNNVAVGYNALQADTLSSQNVAVGAKAMQNASAAASSVAVGYQSLMNDLAGSNNTAVGNNTLQAATAGNQNSALGAGALKSLTTGSQNSAIGYQAGFNGSQSYFVTLGSVNNSTMLGYRSQATCSSCVILGGQGSDATTYGFGTPNPTNFLSAEPVVTTAGTVTITGAPTASVVGSGTSFLTSGAKVGEEIYIASNNTSIATYKGTIATISDDAHLTVSPNITFNINNAPFYILYTGLQVTSAGGVYTAGNLTTQFQVENNSSQSILTVDTVNGRVNIGNGSSGDTTGYLLNLDTKTSAGDPTCVNGAIYYNSSSGNNEFRACRNGTWYNLIAGVDVQTFASNGTWTAPAGISTVMVIACGGGGGGGGGRTRTLGSTAGAGGGGGGGGARVQHIMTATDAGSSQTVTVGGTAGGGGVGTAGTDGNPSSFGTLVKAWGGGGGGISTTTTDSGGGGGGAGKIGQTGQTAASSTGGDNTAAATGMGNAGGGDATNTAGLPGEDGGGAGGGAGTSNGTNGGDSVFGGGGGGAGGGVLATNSSSAGGNGGGNGLSGNGDGSAGGAAGNNAGTVGGSGNSDHCGGGGGGGGSQGLVANISGGNGANGGAPGGGGGGGGAGTSTGTGGTGGAGAGGEVWVFSW